jgi:hypothetical protein
MNRGYIKLWRRSLDSAAWKNLKLWRFWTYCLLKATHKPVDAMVGFQRVHLEPGQFVFGRGRAARETGLSEQSVRTCLQSLSGPSPAESEGKVCAKSTREITVQSTKRFSVITVCNWDSYQKSDNRTNQPGNQDNNPQPTNNQPHTRIKAQKNKELISSGEKPEAVKAGEKAPPPLKLEAHEPPKPEASRPPEGEHKTTWLTPFADIWKEAAGGEMAFGPAAKNLKPLVDKFGTAQVQEHFRNYMKKTTAGMWSFARFATTYGTWGKEQPRKQSIRL